MKQPYSWAIINGKRRKWKDVENRSQYTTFRGTFAVHASKEPAEDAEFKQPPEATLQLGAILGVVDLLAVVKSHPSPWFEGPYGYVLANPRPLKIPIDIRGQQGFWDLPGHVSKEIGVQLGEEDLEEGEMGRGPGKWSPSLDQNFTENQKLRNKIISWLKRLIPRKP